MYNNPQGPDPNNQETYYYPPGQPYQQPPQQSSPEAYQYYQQQPYQQPATPPVPGQFLPSSSPGFQRGAQSSTMPSNPWQWFRQQNKDLQIGIISGVVILLCIIVFGAVAFNSNASAAPTGTNIPNGGDIPTATAGPSPTATPTPMPTPTPTPTTQIIISIPPTPTPKPPPTPVPTAT